MWISKYCICNIFYIMLHDFKYYSATCFVCRCVLRYGVSVIFMLYVILRNGSAVLTWFARLFHGCGNSHCIR